MSMRRGRGTWTAVTVVLLLVAAAAIGYEATLGKEPSARERAQSPIAARPIACEGRRTQTRDSLRDLAWSPSGLGEPVDQDAARGDVRAAALIVSARSICLELRLRRAVPARLDVGVRIHQRQPGGFDASSSASVELRDATAVGGKTVGDDGDGMRTVWYRVRASVSGDTVRVRIPAREVEWRLVRLDRPFRWMADTAQSGREEQLVDLTPWVRHAASAAASSSRSASGSSPRDATPSLP